MRDGPSANVTSTPLRGLVDGDDGVGVDDFRLPVRGGLKHPRQVAANDLDVVTTPTAEQLSVHGHYLLARVVDERSGAHARVCSPHLVEESHPPDDLDPRAADVDLVPAVARTWRSLDEGRSEAVPEEPERKGATGDTAAGNED